MPVCMNTVKGVIAVIKTHLSDSSGSNTVAGAKAVSVVIDVGFGRALAMLVSANDRGVLGGAEVLVDLLGIKAQQLDNATRCRQGFAN